MNVGQSRTLIRDNFGPAAASTLRKVGHNRFAFWSVDDNGAALEHLLYHRTVIATRWSSGTIKLATGGWRTVTTKSTLNQLGRGDYLDGVTPFRIHQQDFSWYVTTSQGTFLWPATSTVLITPEGDVVGGILQS